MASPRPVSLGALVMMMVVGSAARVARADSDRVDVCIAAAERGQELVKAGRLNAATEHFSRCVQANCPATVQRDCLQFAAQVDAAMATIVISVIDEQGSRLKPTRLLVDGAVMEKADIATPIRLEPGPHVIEAITLSGQTSSRIELAPGERGRHVALQIRAQKAEKTEKAEKAEGHRPVPNAVWIAGAVGLAGVATFGVLGALGTSELHDLRARCAPHCAQADLNAATTKLLVGNVALLTGVIALAVAAWIYFERPTVPVTTAVTF
jgi:hypothetical protein